MKSVSARTYSTNYFQRLTLESWYTNLQQTPLNSRMSTSTGALQTTYPAHAVKETDKRNSN